MTSNDNPFRINPAAPVSVDHQPLIDLFELLLEWDMKDVQEKEEKRKEVS